MHALLAPFVAFATLFAAVADGWLGVYLDPMAEAAVVTKVVEDSPAQKAGLQAGDVIVAVGDRATPTRDELVAAVRSHDAGDKVRLKIRRGDKDRLVVVSLAERPEEVPNVEVEAVPEPAAPRRRIAVREAPVATLDDVTNQPAYLGLSLRESDRGVLIDRVVDGGPAAAANVPAGGLLVAVGDRRVTALADLDKALAGVKPGQNVALQVKGEDGVRSIQVRAGVRGEGTAPRVTVETAEVEPQAPSAPRPVKEPKAAKAPKAPAAPAQREGSEQEKDELEAELQSLRAELRELRKQLDDLRRQGGKGK